MSPDSCCSGIEAFSIRSTVIIIFFNSQLGQRSGGGDEKLLFPCLRPKACPISSCQLRHVVHLCSSWLRNTPLPHPRWIPLAFQQTSKWWLLAFVNRVIVSFNCKGLTASTARVSRRCWLSFIMHLAGAMYRYCARLLIATNLQSYPLKQCMLSSSQQIRLPLRQNNHLVGVAGARDHRCLRRPWCLLGMTAASLCYICIDTGIAQGSSFTLLMLFSTSCRSCHNVYSEDFRLFSRNLSQASKALTIASGFGVKWTLTNPRKSGSRPFPKQRLPGLKRTPSSWRIS